MYSTRLSDLPWCSIRSASVQPGQVGTGVAGSAPLIAAANPAASTATTSQYS